MPHDVDGAVQSGATDPDALQRDGGRHGRLVHQRSVVRDARHVDDLGQWQLAPEKTARVGRASPLSVVGGVGATVQGVNTCLS